MLRLKMITDELRARGIGTSSTGGVDPLTSDKLDYPGKILLVDDDDVAHGCTSVVREWSDWNAGFYWWIQSMYIVPERRGQGLMTGLLNAVQMEMESQKGLELRLYVHRKNDKAVRAYKKAGFEKSPYEIMVR